MEQPCPPGPLLTCISENLFTTVVPSGPPGLSGQLYLYFGRKVLPAEGKYQSSGHTQKAVLKYRFLAPERTLLGGPERGVAVTWCSTLRKSCPALPCGGHGEDCVILSLQAIEISKGGGTFKK